MTIFTNPIISREILTQLRMPRRLFSLMGLLVISTVVFCIAYAFVTDQTGDLEQGGRFIFFPMVYVAMFIGIPIATMSAASIVREREEETLDLMMTTPMSHSAMIAGKVLATLLYSLFFLFAMLPFFYFSSIAGGISFNEMSQCIAVLFGFYCSVAMIGTFISLISVSSNIAGRYAITIILLIYLGPSMFGVIFGVFGFHPLVMGTLMVIGGLLNPVYAILMTQLPTNYASLPQFRQINDYSIFGIPLNDVFMYYVNNSGYVTGICNLVFAVLLFFITVIIFRVFSNRLSTRFSYSNMLTNVIKRQKPKHPALTKDDHKTVSFDDGSNVIFQKEKLLMNRKILSNVQNVLIGSILVTTVLTWFSLAKIIVEVHKMPGDFIYLMLCVFCTIITVLFSPITPSYAVLVEHQKDTWELLRTTLIKSRNIIHGKIWNGFYQASIPLLGITGSFLITYNLYMVLNGIPVQWNFVIQSMFIIAFFLSCIYFYNSVGVLYSSKTRKNRSSPHFYTFSVILFHFLTPYLLFVASYIFLYFGLGVRSQRMQQSLYHFFETTVYPISPVYVFLETNWGIGLYIYFTLYGSLLVFLGVIVGYAASAEIKKQV